MNVFRLRDEVVDGYADYVRSFLTIADLHIKGYVEARLAEGHLWPEALVQPNPASETGATSDELVAQGVLHLETSRVFRRLKETVPEGAPLQLRMHQEEAVRIARTGASYVLTTGTGSGKSLTYFVPIMDDALSNPAPGRIKAIVETRFDKSDPNLLKTREFVDKVDEIWNLVRIEAIKAQGGRGP